MSLESKFSRRNFLKRAAVGAVGLPVLNAFGEPTRPRIVTKGIETIRKTTLSKDWLAWQKDGDIWYANRADLSTHFNLTNTGLAGNPNIDGDNLVYNEKGCICLTNLRTGDLRILYDTTTKPSESCFSPKINGDNVVFRVSKTNSTETWDEIWAKPLNGRRERPITNTRRPRGNPDIYGNIVVWPELINKPDSREYLIGGPGLVAGDWDILAYNLETHVPFTINNSPEWSSSSVAIHGNKVVMNHNTVENGETRIEIYYLDTGRHRVSNDGVIGEIHEMAYHGKIISWRRRFFNDMIPNRIQLIILEDVRSYGFMVSDTGGDQHSPDSYEGPGGTGEIAYVDSSFQVHDSNGLVALTTSSEPAEEKALLVNSLGRINHPLYLVCENWLKGDLPDINGDGKVNFYDFAHIASTIKKQENK